MNNKPHQPGKVFVADVKNKVLREKAYIPQTEDEYNDSRPINGEGGKPYLPKQYPATWLTEEMDGRELAEGVDFEIDVDYIRRIDGSHRAEESAKQIQPQTVFVPCDENDPDLSGGYTSMDGQSLCYVKEITLPASSSIERQKDEEVIYHDYKSDWEYHCKVSGGHTYETFLELLLDDAEFYKIWCSKKQSPSAPTISKEDERVARNRNTIYTYYQVEFNYCSAFDGDYMICESIEQITDLLKQVDINLDDPEVKATVEIKGIPMTPAEYETWLKENDTSF